MKIRVHQLPHGRNLPLPQPASPGSAGCDLRAAVDEPVTLEPGTRTLIPTGLVREIQAGYEGQVRPRSGLALHHGVTIVNTPGTIDSDYRGEVRVLLINLGQEPFTVEHGDRIAQLLVAPVQSIRFEAVDTLSDSGRGSGGFGSTGRG